MLGTLVLLTGCGGDEPVHGDAQDLPSIEDATAPVELKDSGSGLYDEGLQTDMGGLLDPGTATPADEGIGPQDVSQADVGQSGTQLLVDNTAPVSGEPLTIRVQTYEGFTSLTVPYTGPCDSQQATLVAKDTNSVPAVWTFEILPIAAGTYELKVWADALATPVAGATVEVGGDPLCPIGPGSICPEIGLVCEDHYPEVQTCSTNSQAVEVQCHKYGQCVAPGDGTQCSWGEGSWCEDPCDVVTPTELPCADSPGQRYGVNIDPKNPAGFPAPQTLKAAGVRWVRLVFKDPQISMQPSQAELEFYQNVVDTMHAAGIRVLMVLNYETVPGKPPSGSSLAAWGPYKTKYVERVVGIAAHFGDTVDAWQIWNEPDLDPGPDSGYDVHVPASVLGPMATSAYGGMKIHSSMPIVLGGMASGNPNYVAQVLNAAGSDNVPFDVLGVHPYGQQAPAGWPDIGWGFGPMDSLLNAYLNQAEGRPVWITEIGTSDTTYQSDYVTNVYTMIEQVFPQTVPHVFWFCWSDAMVPPFGLVYADGSSKSTYFSYQEKAQQASDECP